MYKLSSNGFKFITNFERLEIEAYLDSAGVATIGYGTTELNGWPVALGMLINEQVANALLMGSCQSRLRMLESCIRVDLNQNQVDALVSLSYNIGQKGFLSSSLLQAINNKLAITEDLFTRWNKVRSNGILVDSQGLIERRKSEYKLYNTRP